jgi:hypothetical protein
MRVGKILWMTGWAVFSICVLSCIVYVASGLIPSGSPLIPLTGVAIALLAVLLIWIGVMLEEKIFQRAGN